jgi:excisionase family DNA binding protein
MNNRPLSKSEAAALIGCCEKTLERLIADGKIKAHRIANRWKVFERDLDAYLEAGCNKRPAGQNQPAVAGVDGGV